MATLAVLTWVAAHRAGIRGARLVVAGLGGGAVGIFVISLQILLKPL